MQHTSKIRITPDNSHKLWPNARNAHDFVVEIWNARWNGEGKYDMAEDAHPDMTFPFVPQRKFESHTTLTHLSSGYLDPNYPKRLSPIFELVFFNLCAKDIGDFVHDTMSDLIRISPVDWHKRELAKYLQFSLSLLDGQPISVSDPKDIRELISLYVQLNGKSIEMDLKIAEIINAAMKKEIENFNQSTGLNIALLGQHSANLYL